MSSFDIVHNYILHIYWLLPSNQIFNSYFQGCDLVDSDPMMTGDQQLQNQLQPLDWGALHSCISIDGLLYTSTCTHTHTYTLIREQQQLEANVFLLFRTRMKERVGLDKIAMEAAMDFLHTSSQFNYVFTEHGIMCNCLIC